MRPQVKSSDRAANLSLQNTAPSSLLWINSLTSYLTKTADCNPTRQLAVTLVPSGRAHTPLGFATSDLDCAKIFLFSMYSMLHLTWGNTVPQLTSICFTVDY